MPADRSARRLSVACSVRALPCVPGGGRAPPARTRGTGGARASPGPTIAAPTPRGLACQLTPLLDQLRKGDRRSIGRANAVARAVLRSPQRFPELVAGLWHPDALVRMRAGDALEKVSRQQPGWLWPLRSDLLGLAKTAEEQEARWHLAQILPRLGLRGAQRAALVALLRRYLKDRSAIVRVSALQGVADLAAFDSALRPLVRRHLRRLLAAGSPAEQARARSS